MSAMTQREEAVAAIRARREAHITAATPPPSPAKTPAPRGFAAMDQSRQKQIASLGGRTAHERGQAHEFTSEEARQAGRKGGETVSRNRDHMAAIGRRGGAARSVGLQRRQAAANAMSPSPSGMASAAAAPAPASAPPAAVG